MRYLKNPPYISGDEKSMETRTLGPMKANVELKAAKNKSRADYRKEQALQIVALRNNEVCEKVFLDYEVKYSFK